MGESTREVLIQKLQALLPALDEEGIAFLVRQATILKQNAEVAALENELEELRRSDGADAPGKDADESAGGVEIEQIAQDSFVIQVGRHRVFFVRDELRKIARIVHAAEDKQSGRRRLYSWFDKERRDFLLDTGIARASDPVLERIFEIVLSRYKPKS
jgi:hypothetical protein